MSKASSKAARAAVEDGIREILSDVLLCDEAQLTSGTRLAEDLGMDSLDRTEIVMRIEDELLAANPIPEDLAEGWKTVGDVLGIVDSIAGVAR
jgi:acyl carrier protein